MVHRNANWFAGGIIDEVENLIREFKEANVFGDRVRFNFDASWKTEDRIVGVGVVIRDHKGDFFVGMSKL